MRNLTLASIAVVASAVAWAQSTPAVQQLGRVAEVKGLVTMSIGSQVGTVQPQTPVFDGARFVASSAGEAEIRFEDGCVLRLKPNQVYTVDAQQTCDVRIASIETLQGPRAGAIFARDALPLLAAAAAAAAVARVSDTKITPTPQ